MSKQFSVSSSIILRSEPQYYDTYVAFDYKTTRAEFVTRQQYSVLEHVSDKSATIDEISKATGMKYGRCEQFLKHMLQLGYVVDDVDASRPPEGIEINTSLYERFVLPVLSAPTSVDVFITSRCNLNCVHCFSSTEEQTSSDLSAEELKLLFDQLEKLKVFEVRINGGEPFLHPEIDEILAILKDRRFRKVILTNGTLLNEKTINLLRESEVISTLSLDDSSSERHDLFRGVKGSFDRTIEAMKLLEKHGPTYGINCCLHRMNLNRYNESYIGITVTRSIIILSGVSSQPCAIGVADISCRSTKPSPLASVHLKM